METDFLQQRLGKPLFQIVDVGNLECLKVFGNGVILLFGRKI